MPAYYNSQIIPLRMKPCCDVVDDEINVTPSLFMGEGGGEGVHNGLFITLPLIPSHRGRGKVGFCNSGL